MELEEVIIIGGADERRRSLSMVRRMMGGVGVRGSRRRGVGSQGGRGGGGDIREQEQEQVENVEAGDEEVEVEAVELQGEAQHGEGGAEADVAEDNQNHLLRNIRLYRAALKNDWETAEDIFKRDPNADTASVTSLSETLLHIAVGTNRSHRFVDHLIDRIVKKNIAKLRTTNDDANNALHIAAIVGNTKAAEALVARDLEMTSIPGKDEKTPVQLAAYYAQRETLEYLWKVTPKVMIEIGNGKISSYSGEKGVELLACIIRHGFYDLAIELIKEFPNLATETYSNKFALEALAAADGLTAFPDKDPFTFICTYNRRKRILHDARLKRKQALELMKIMIHQILNKENQNHKTVLKMLGKAMSIAARYGNHEMIAKCLVQYPGLILHVDDDRMNLFMTAIKHRQVKVYNLVHQMSTGHVGFLASSKNNDGENALHLVARKVSHTPLSTSKRTSAALQMQRELQWFKEVEKFVGPSCKNDLNRDNKTGLMIFMEEHAELMEKGEKEVKNTAKSLALVAVLIVTVAFAAIFTVPGGNKDDGTPRFLGKSNFMTFLISDVVALVSSIASLLLSLSLLTSHYAQDDFLQAIPMKLTLGLATLFISIAAIMSTYTTAIFQVLTDKFRGIGYAVAVIAYLLMCFYNGLQNHLLLDIYLATFGTSIFHKQNNLILH